ncbi:aminotransferase class V-fold PLP-dependent enzyme [Anaerococcus sp. Marseille-Q7828]|uniref:aminotransferase class V-fold PLP-dependent enzyme n=1 Tax=Anaerococcus sp. Marseille-Q7828 TaxID=3036300 RepID=UPI0024AD5728|nr:aminotransferase class V-fold PLP-dependent enzyme [Anaerococcus sp. Marseille-Q7828]
MLNEKLDQYLREDYYPFHMPGSKRTNILREDIPYKRDLTEINGFDNLNDPKDIFCQMEEKIADIYQVEDAIISTNGSTCGILSTIRALTYENKNILIQRSSHKSVYNAIELNNLKSDYINVIIDNMGAIIDIDYKDLEEKLSNKDYAAIVITSPSYEGYYLDLGKIYDIAKIYSTPLIVDMAHGSHSILTDKYYNDFDIAITSFHKNLSALTPSSGVLINNKDYSKEIRRNMAIFQTSSPSYVILQSIDEMIDKFPEFYHKYSDLEKNLDAIYELNLDHLEIVHDNKKDRSKILVSTANTDIDGFILEEMLRDRKIEIEMSYPTYALLIASIFDSKIGFDRLQDALMDIDKRIKKSTNNFYFSYKIPEKSLEISETIVKGKSTVNIGDSAGKICGQFVYAYPPGIPILSPGEVIDKDIISTMRYMTDHQTKLNIGDTILILD